MHPFDPRLTPVRPDLAAIHLKGKVEAAHFAEGELREIIDAQASVRGSPSPDALLLTEAGKGERVTIYELTEEGWAWGQLEADGYVGWLPGTPPRHKVAVPRPLVFPGPSITRPPMEALPFGARIAIVRGEGQMGVMASGGYVPARHLVPVGSTAHDPYR